MSRRRPKNSRVLSVVAPIEYVSSLEEGEVLLDGHWEPTKPLIRIKRKLMPDAEAETLIHEVLHQLFDAGIDVPEDLEEAIVKYLGRAIFAHVRENPTFWRYIFGTAHPRRKNENPVVGH